MPIRKRKLGKEDLVVKECEKANRTNETKGKIISHLKDKKMKQRKEIIIWCKQMKKKTEHRGKTVTRWKIYETRR